MNSNELATQILSAVGEKSNIISAASCMTRLHLTIADFNLVCLEQLKTLPRMLSVLNSVGQLQIILGPGTTGVVTKAFAQLAEIELGEVKDLRAAISDKNQPPLNCSFVKWPAYLS